MLTCIFFSLFLIKTSFANFSNPLYIMYSWFTILCDSASGVRLGFFVKRRQYNSVPSGGGFEGAAGQLGSVGVQCNCSAGGNAIWPGRGAMRLGPVGGNAIGFHRGWLCSWLRGGFRLGDDTPVSAGKMLENVIRMLKMRPDGVIFNISMFGDGKMWITSPVEMDFYFNMRR